MTLITGSTMERTSTNVTTMSSMSPQDPSSPPAGSTNSDWAVASAEWSRSRAERLRHVVSRCRAQVAGILFIDDLLRRDRGGTATTELLALFQARMLQPGELLTCRSDFCDRLVIPIEGVLRFTHHNDKDDAVVREVAERAREQHRNLDGGTLLSAAAIPDDPCVVPLNECLGFSCLVSHRWTRSVVAATVCRVIELERADYEAFLRRRGWLALVAARTRLLLFPNALSVGVVPKPGTLASLVRAMLNRSGGIQQRGGGGPPGGHDGPVGGMSLPPLMFPVSGSGTVAPHEIGFGMEGEGAVRGASLAARVGEVMSDSADGRTAARWMHVEERSLFVRRGEAAPAVGSTSRALAVSSRPHGDRAASSDSVSAVSSGVIGGAGQGVRQRRQPPSPSPGAGRSGVPPRSPRDDRQRDILLNGSVGHRLAGLLLEGRDAPPKLRRGDGENTSGWSRGRTLVVSAS